MRASGVASHPAQRAAFPARSPMANMKANRRLMKIRTSLRMLKPGQSVKPRDSSRRIERKPQRWSNYGAKEGWAVPSHDGYDQSESSCGEYQTATWADAELGVVVLSMDDASPKKSCLTEGRLSVVSVSYTAKTNNGVAALMDAAIAMVGEGRGLEATIEGKNVVVMLRSLTNPVGAALIRETLRSGSNSECLGTPCALNSRNQSPEGATCRRKRSVCSSVSPC